VVAERASMGPRSVERGKSATREYTSGILELQWGRVLLNAETAGVVGAAAGIMRFNGAAFC